jgi:hypothetical protein
VHRLVPSLWRQRHNDVAGFIYAALGMIYAVLLALLVIAVWGEYQAADETVEQEANAAAEIFWLGNRLRGEPAGFRANLKGRRTALRERTRPDREPCRCQEDTTCRVGRGRARVLWPVLVFGGIATVGFTYLFGLESTWSHRLMVLTLAAAIGLVLCTVGALGHPFAGGARIGTGAFDLILERFDTSKLNDLK